MEFGINGKAAVVTGGGSGVGRAIALGLAKEGVNVVVADINMDNANMVVEKCKDFGVDASSVRVDLSDQIQTYKMIEDAENAIGSPIQILINNAGYWPTNIVKDTSLKEWNLTFDINMTAVFTACKALTNSLISRGIKGKILNITSQAAFNGATTGHAHYAAAKSAVVTFTLSMAKEVAKYGINVNSMALGLVNTPMIAKALEENREYYENRVPFKRLAEPEEVANMAIFLVSKKANYFTAGAFDATGGMLSR